MTGVIRWGVRVGKTLAVLAIVGLALWWALALRFAGPLSESANSAAGLVVVICGVLAIAGLFVERLRWALAAFSGVVLLLFLWWQGIHPSNDRKWAPEVAVQPKVEIDGDRVVVRNIRNFQYRTETDFTPSYYDKEFDLRKLDRGDLIASYWMGDAIAHMFISFGFGSEDFLAISIETRKEEGEAYSPLAGFFKRYELQYVVADERDLIGVRTNYRKDPPEDVYVYRTNATPENLRRLFLDYVREINLLTTEPAFYNTATTNCTTNIWMHTHVNQSVPFNWKILLSGYVPEYAHEQGRLHSKLPFPELRRRSRVNDAAVASGLGADFSARIRADLPD